MKKTFLLILLFGISSLHVIAADNPSYDPTGSNTSTPTMICTVTSEPFGNDKCTRIGGGPDPQMARYKCCVSAESGFTDFISNIYKYIFFISLVLGVLFMVVLGIGISISGFDEGKIKEKAKTQLVATIIGIMALALIPWILRTVAPFIFK